MLDKQYWIVKRNYHYEIFIECENVRKRRADDQDCSAGFCCLKSVYFDFHKNGMKNVVSPPGYVN